MDVVRELWSNQRVLVFFVFFLVCTVYDGLAVHLLWAERGEELRRDRVPPVLGLAGPFLLQGHGVWQQCQWIFNASAESHTHTV